ncbi:insulinase family protein [Clostridium oryzae]|uniref:Peptidase M16C associated n=1 Tax=Clostridium oryzae TaxID=1450648 RepID=A0A1V4ING9_9CLOT|nr:insulinase family protein [Clostridium oryzae]OPJ61315.1 peptidase M16C associated [Clostridium oryzae]
MNYKVGEVYNGFKLLEERYIKEISSSQKLFLHEKSGAKLLALQNDDDNKVFSASFRTPAGNNMGIPHIIEHTVLCGSRKFKTKEPFVDLLKCSLNTFLNAITYPDKTVYPVASCNEKDLMNLMDVYLDAVFYPGIYEHPEFFLQEGWHYELDEKSDELTINGVVYNEMKGALSNPDGLLERHSMKSLFPNTTYQYESGGDPDYIPELTHENFLDFHRKYYHPSNCYLYLYGNGDLDKQMAFINDEYLSHFDKKEIESSIEFQKPLSKMQEVSIDFSSDELKNNAYIALNYAVGNALDAENHIAFSMLQNILIDSQASPLKKAILSSGIAKVVDGYFSTSMLQPYFSIFIKNADENSKDKFTKLVHDTLTELVKNGIDEKLKEAAVNRKEFELREADFSGYPKGLIYNLTVLESWIYDGSPTLHLEYEKALENIKSKYKGSYFEDLIEKYILKNTHSSLLTLVPKKGVSEAKAEQLNKKLANIKANLSDEDIKQIKENMDVLKKRQTEDDSPEAIATIPSLKIEDVDPKIKHVDVKEIEASGIKILLNEATTNKISYVNFMFDTTTVPLELIPYTGILKYLLGKINTKNYSYEDLSNIIGINTGGIYADSEVTAVKDSADEFKAGIVIRGKSLAEKQSLLIDYIKEIVNNTIFTDKNRILELVRNLKSNIENVIYSRGNSIAAQRTLSYFSAKSKYTDMTAGIGFYLFLSSIEKDFDNQFTVLEQNLEKIYKTIFTKDNLLINVVTEKESFSSLNNNISDFILSLGNCDKCSKTAIAAEKLNEGFTFPSEVQYVAKGSNFISKGFKNTGALKVAKTIINYEYLWVKVRMQGGAYGCGISSSIDGSMWISSYRDPRLKETIAAYNDLPDYIENLNLSDEEISRYIIGTISPLDTPLTPSMRGDFTLGCYLSGITEEDIQKERTEILHTGSKEIKALAPLFKSVFSDNNVCVLGNRAKINENKDVFSEVKTLID